MPAGSSPVTVRIFQLTTACTLLAVALGSVVCATESGFECGNWPGCTESSLLPSGPLSAALYRNPWIEMLHRTSAIVAGPLAVVSGILAARLRTAPLAAKVLPWVTVAGALVAGIFGRMIVLGQPLPAWGGAADLTSALTAMGAMVTATVALRAGRSHRTAGPAALAWTSLGALLAMHLTSLFAAGPGSYTRCLSWPVWGLIAADHAANPVASWLRLGLAVAAAALIVTTVVAARRQPRLRWEALAVAILLGVVGLLAAAIRLTGTTDLGVPFSLATVGLLFALVLLAARATLAGRPSGVPTPHPEPVRA